MGALLASTIQHAVRQPALTGVTLIKPLALAELIVTSSSYRFGAANAITLRATLSVSGVET